MTWDRSGKPRALLPLFGDTHSEALAINRRGEVVWRSDELTAVVWARDGTPTALLLLPGDDLSYGAAINSRGEVAGTSVSVPPGDRRLTSLRRVTASLALGFLQNWSTRTASPSRMRRPTARQPYSTSCRRS